jgi:hypothetical protein
LGQTTKYWKIPLVYGALGTSIYFIYNNKKIPSRRLQSRLEGYTTDDLADNNRLIAGQKFYQKIEIYQP